MVRRIKVGDEFQIKPAGTIVTVSRYHDTTCIEVKDKDGHTRTVNAQSLLTGRLHWRYKDGTLKRDLFTFEDVQAKAPVKKVRQKDDPNEYYVYICSVAGKIVYVGQGKGNRYKHTISGISNNYQLNKSFFAREFMMTEIYRSGLSREEALALEADLIVQLKPAFNKYGK